MGDLRRQESLLTARTADLDALRARVQRVLVWVAKQGCTCSDDGDLLLSEHQDDCPGHIEYLLTTD